MVKKPNWLQLSAKYPRRSFAQKKGFRMTGSRGVELEQGYIVNNPGEVMSLHFSSGYSKN